jgi:ABC-type phosphate/phosphonate transport system substrate-binding protein
LKDLPGALKQDLRNVLLGMQRDPEGAEILASAGIARFSRVDDSDYDAIRKMAQQAERFW